ncbi:Fe-Mn family superoxide dismutase [Robinsoniella sp. RHS]|uniref:superoxide dismutase n=1 Tax=Robinsoniella sp. RHS TaxID=1504536 RepID=UPI00064A21B9
MSEHYPFVNYPLPYSYNALEPYIDEKTMHLHHDRHLQTYVDNLNAILKANPQLQNMTLEQLILYAPTLPANIRTPLLNNAGGVYNHRFYFDNMTSPGIDRPLGIFAFYINQAFGSFQNFEDQMAAAALSVFGSGYSWLVADHDGTLKIITTSNQDTPLSMNLHPLLNLDVWEHAYYLKHYNNRPAYIHNWFHVVNWKTVSQNYLAFINGYT